ncbi:hypothetical protein [Phaffia rhodozyma]|uniref:Uncharacterized protein n=1 Tax=Phaffia rhodozyma TaxID=264483 RepID=A0A0F7SFK7_PHARH|nr:hypothetical protein [Phaffia rhodozyma]
MTTSIEPSQKALKKPRRSRKKIPPIRPDLPHHEKPRPLKDKSPIPSRPSSSQERISRLILDQRLRFDKLKRRDDMLLIEKICNAPLSQREFIDRHMSKSTKPLSTTHSRRRALLPPIEYFAIWLQTNLVVLIQNIVQRALDDLSVCASRPAYDMVQYPQLFGSPPSLSSSSPARQVSPSIKRLNKKPCETLHDIQLRNLEGILQRVLRLANENRLATQPRIILLHHLQSKIPPTTQVSTETASYSFLPPETLSKPPCSLSSRPSRTQRSLAKSSPRPIDALWSRYLCMIPYPASPSYKVIFDSLVWDRDCILLLVDDVQLPKNLPKDPNNKTFDRALWNLPPEGIHDLLSLTVWKSKRVDEAHVVNLALKARLDERRAREDFSLKHGDAGVRRPRPIMGVGEVNWLRIGKEQRDITGTFAGKSIE